VIAEARKKELVKVRIAARAVCFHFTPERAERYVILGLAGNLAGKAADAFVQID